MHQVVCIALNVFKTFIIIKAKTIDGLIDSSQFHQNHEAYKRDINWLKYSL